MTHHDPFQYQTYRLAWYIQARPLDVPLLPVNEYGPFPTKQLADDHAIALAEERERSHMLTYTFKTVSRYELVDIDPILQATVQGIAQKVRGWYQEPSDPTSPFAPRPSGYVRVANVEASLNQLAEVILKTFVINKENPDVSEDEEQD
jgi:hypothetical protein